MNKTRVLGETGANAEVVHRISVLGFGGFKKEEDLTAALQKLIFGWEDTSVNDFSTVCQML